VKFKGLPPVESGPPLESIQRKDDPCARPLVAMTAISRPFKSINLQNIAVEVSPDSPPGRLSSPSAPARAAAQTATWNGGAGNWNNAGNWTPAIVPNSGTTSVFIDGGMSVVASVVNLDITAAVNALTIDAGDTLSFNAGVGLTLGGGANRQRPARRRQQRRRGVVHHVLGNQRAGARRQWRGPFRRDRLHAQQ